MANDNLKAKIERFESGGLNENEFWKFKGATHAIYELPIEDLQLIIDLRKNQSDDLLDKVLKNKLCDLLMKD